MIIGLSGPKKSGKSTAAQVLQNLGYNRVSFAYPLKKIVSDVLNIDMVHFTDEVAKEQPMITIFTRGLLLQLLEKASADFCHIPESVIMRAVSACSLTIAKTPRQLLQLVGSELFRDLVDPEYWLRCFDLAVNSTGSFVVDDVRFENEANHVRNRYNGRVVMIKRLGLTNSDTHKSEQFNFDSDYTLSNSDLDMFKLEVSITAELIKDEVFGAHSV